jgi:glycosyltransferase involved in cell wall biosynthesis
MGYGELEKEIKEVAKEYNNIYFHPAVSPDILLEFTSSADFGISTIEDSCLSYRYCLPNKMFEYLMAEIPVIVSNLYELKRLVESNQIGVVAKENTPNGLKDAIQEAIKLNKEKLKTNIKKLKTIYNWENQEKVLLKVYGEL